MTVVHCWLLTVLHCCSLTVLHCCSLTVLHWALLTVLHCCSLTVLHCCCEPPREEPSREPLPARSCPTTCRPLICGAELDVATTKRRRSLGEVMARAG